MPRLAATRLESERLVLEPLALRHADELAPVLDDAALHRFIGGDPLDAAALRSRFTRLLAGTSPDGRQDWLNWTVRERASGRAAGTVQATVGYDEPDVVAELLSVSRRRPGAPPRRCGALAR